MDNLVEYIRVAFELIYMDESRKFHCISSQVKRGITRCVCVPGVVMNYAMVLAAQCYKGLEIGEHIHWDQEYGTYLPCCVFAEKKVIPNLRRKMNRADAKDEFLFTDEMCSEDISDFSYIKLRVIDVLKSRYGESLEKQKTEKELLLLRYHNDEDFGNSTDYFRLFIMVAEAYRTEFDFIKYSENLFRLFLFLVPYTALKIIRKNLKGNKDNQEFQDFNKRIIEEYAELGVDTQQFDVSSDCYLGNTVDEIRKFTGFNFMKIYSQYQEEHADIGELGLKNLIKRQMDICAKEQKRIRDLLDEL